jgi:hypothetical protein
MSLMTVCHSRALKEKSVVFTFFDCLYKLSSQCIWELSSSWLKPLTYFSSVHSYILMWIWFLSHKTICYTISYFKRKIILKSPIYFDQRVVLFDLRSWKCVLKEDRRYSLILGGCVSRDPITPSYTLREARINL